MPLNLRKSRIARLPQAVWQVFAMSVPASLLPELEEVVQHGSAEKRAETLHRITSLFLDGAPSFNKEHVALFDDVIGCLIEEIEVKALAELARRLAPVPNAPTGVVVALARNDDIAVAGPVLKQAHIGDPDLKYIAETKSQAHLLALSTRLGINETLSKTIVHNYGHGGGGITLSWGTAHLAVEQALPTNARRMAVLGAGAVGLATAR